MSHIVITDDDIAEAELAILGEGVHFNESQVAFIKRLDTIDLTACPGSGKTTALVAKLYILAKYETWSEGDPICVISHTRIAIDEIKEKVASHFPKIMDYPNFIGTIQQFMDKFLAIPYYKSLGFSEVKAIDDDIFLNKWRTQNTQTLRIYLMNSGGCQNDDDYRKKIASISYHHDRQVKIDPSDLVLANNTSASYIQALTAKENLFKAGYLTYADTRVLASEYIERYPNIAEILNNRFCYIFLDEAQDTSLEQMTILEQFTESNCYQRIGDPLQTIFNADNDSSDVWQIRSDSQEMKLLVSNRFGTNIAKLVNHVGVSLSSTNELTSDVDDSVYQKSIALLFEDDNPPSVIDWFRSYANQELSFLQEKDIYVIGAAGKEKEDRLTIPSYITTYKNDRRKKSDYFKNSTEYFKGIDKKSIQKLGSNLVYDRISKLLISELKNVDTNLATQDIKNKLLNDSTEMSLLVIDVVRSINSNQPVPFDRIATKLQNEARRLFDTAISISFNVEAGDETEEENSDDETLQVSTIHGVKGQTHDATLLLTTQFHNTGASSRTGEIGGTDLDYLLHSTNSDRDIRRRRLLYVSSSRPRYLFVWAIPKSKRTKLSSIESLFTEVIEI